MWQINFCLINQWRPSGRFKPNQMAEKSFNKERFWWVAFAGAISAVWFWSLSVAKDANAFKDKVISQQSAQLTFKDSACAIDKRNIAKYYEGVIRGKDSIILALKDDKYRSVLDILNVRKVNGKIKIEQ